MQIESKPISRILYADKISVATIHLGRWSPNGSSDLPGARSPKGLRTSSPQRLPIWSCTAKSLPGRACCQTRRCALTAPFHPSPSAQWRKAGLFSVALVVTALSNGLARHRKTQRPAVNWFVALWCSDFPPINQSQQAVAQLTLMQGRESITKCVV